MSKKIFGYIAIFLSIFMLCFLSSCKKEKDFSLYTGAGPDLAFKDGEYQLDFVNMHNYVIDTISAEYNPFFFVKEGQFDISGDNESKNIKVKCTCLKGTEEHEADLFLSLVLTYISINASEQDYRFKAPTTDSDGTYLDYGTVFNTYSLDIYADTDDGVVLKNLHVNPGNKIPIDSRYWME